MNSAYKLSKQGDNIQPWHTPFPICNQSIVPCSFDIWNVKMTIHVNCLDILGLKYQNNKQCWTELSFPLYRPCDGPVNIKPPSPMPSFFPVHAFMLSHIQPFATPWTIACQAPLSMGFPKQGYWSGLPFPLPGDLPDPGIELASPGSPALQVDSLPTEPPGLPTVLRGNSALGSKQKENPHERKCPAYFLSQTRASPTLLLCVLTQ